jgi:hypothetical protein
MWRDSQIAFIARYIDTLWLPAQFVVKPCEVAASLEAALFSSRLFFSAMAAMGCFFGKAKCQIYPVQQLKFLGFEVDFAAQRFTASWPISSRAPRP